MSTCLQVKQVVHAVASSTKASSIEMPGTKEATKHSLMPLSTKHKDPGAITYSSIASSPYPTPNTKVLFLSCNPADTISRKDQTPLISYQEGPFLPRKGSSVVTLPVYPGSGSQKSQNSFKRNTIT